MHSGQPCACGGEWQVQTVDNGRVSLVALPNKHASSAGAALPTLPHLALLAGLAVLAEVAFMNRSLFGAGGSFHFCCHRIDTQ